jgi:hypothetical protein
MYPTFLERPRGYAASRATRHAAPSRTRTTQYAARRAGVELELLAVHRERRVLIQPGSQTKAAHRLRQPATTVEVQIARDMKARVQELIRQSRSGRCFMRTRLPGKVPAK